MTDLVERLEERGEDDAARCIAEAKALLLYICGNRCVFCGSLMDLSTHDQPCRLDRWLKSTR